MKVRVLPAPQSPPKKPAKQSVRGTERDGGGDSLRVTTDNQPKSRKEKNKMAECKACGHRDTQHAKFGCNQGFCKCELSNQDVIDFEKLAALREAGEKMALQLRILSKSSYFTREDAESLTEWEAANK